MDEFVMYRLLDLINKKETISAMFKLGYSYSSIAKWFSYLEDMEYIYTEGDVSKFITQKGKNKLHDLERKYKNKTICILEQYKVKKMELEEIYLP